MKKLRLDVDALAVESYATEDAGDVLRGTVQAEEGPRLTRTSCGGYPECTCPPPPA